jgi:hypothetical protein
MAEIKVGTFTLNNLFSRFNFKASVSDAVITTEETTVYAFAQGSFTERKYVGKLVKEKPEDDTATIAARIAAMDVDVLAVQEVEDIDTLKEFGRNALQGRYPHVALIEGNDPRLIDVGILSKLPLGAVTSWQHAVDPDDPSGPIFSRDLLEVEIYSANRKARLFTLFNTHLKSHFVPFNDPDPQGAAKAAAPNRAKPSPASSPPARAPTAPTSSSAT